MRLIDADAAYEAACDGADNWDGGCSPYRDDCIREEMDKVPTAVVRCGDCRWGIMCVTGQHLGLDGFCSKGERKAKK